MAATKFPSLKTKLSPVLNAPLVLLGHGRVLDGLAALLGSLTPPSHSAAEETLSTSTLKIELKGMNENNKAE